MFWCSRCLLWASHRLTHTHRHTIHTHISVTPVSSKSSVSLSGEYVTVFMVCLTGSRMHWMLSTVNYTPLSSRSFIQEDSLCIPVRDLCNFPARFIVTIKQGICVFSLFHKRIKLYFYAVIVHMYLCTECVYWYETHTYCYLCIAKFI